MKKRIITILLGCATLLSTAAPSILTIKETITDNAIVYPESFETDTDKMLKNWYLQNYAVLDEGAVSAPAGDLSDEVIKKRLSLIPAEIEMPFNQVVKSYITMYVERRRQLVENMLGMSLYYMPIFEQALEREGMPLELRYLPVIESALNPDAVSRVGATGLWQFMLPTAKGLGLEINTLVDERRDPYRSSDAAAKYLKQLYGIYNDWSLAIAAYNCGPGNVNKALRRAGGEDSKEKKDFWAIYYYLPAETRGYVPAFIAANYVMTYYNQHNISPALARRPLITDSVHVTKRVHFRQIADVLQMPVEEIRVLNPQYRRDIIPGNVRPCPLVLPSKQVYCYIMSEDSIVAHDAKLYARRDAVEPTDIYSSSGDYDSKLVIKYHKVKRGENLGSIARRYGVTVNQLKKWNGLKKNTIRRGQRLKIHTYERVAKPKKPVEETEIAASEAPVMDAEKPTEASTAPADSVATEAVVAEADSTKVEAAKAEEKPAEKVEKKEQSKKKKSTVEKKKEKKKKESKPKYRTHKVRKGETLSSIAGKYRGVTVKDIRKANGISGSKIKVGQKLKIPYK